MNDKSLELSICPKCGSTEYFENFPAPGLSICVECGQEITRIQLREMAEEEIIQQNCPFCGKEGEEDDTLFDEENILVYKCKRCGKLDGYRVALKPPDGTEPLPRQHSTKRQKKPKPVSLYKLEGDEPVYSAEEAKKLVKILKNAEKDPREKCKRKLDNLISNLRQKMQQKGIEYETINRAKWKLQNFIDLKGPFTEKQLRSQFSAVVSLKQDELIRMGKFNGKRVTQRQIKEIFNVDRKTTRKWKNIFTEHNKHIKLGILTRVNGNHEHAIVEFPTEVKSIIPIKPPHEDTCDFCQKTQLLSRRINFNKGSWSDICEKTYESLMRQSVEHEWELEKRVIRN
jgi:hypothetical protein